MILASDGSWMVGALAIGVGVAGVVQGLTFFPSGVVEAVVVVAPLVDTVPNGGPLVIVLVLEVRGCLGAVSLTKSLVAHRCPDNIAEEGLVKVAAKKVTHIEALLVMLLVAAPRGPLGVVHGIAVALVVEGHGSAVAFSRRVRVIAGVNWRVRTLVLALGEEGSAPRAVPCEALGGMTVRTVMAELLLHTRMMGLWFRLVQAYLSEVSRDACHAC